MTELPKEQLGATEMMFCRLRYEVIDALRNSKIADGNWNLVTSVEIIAERDKAINELEKLLEEKYLRYADPSIPLHLLCTFMAKCVTCTVSYISQCGIDYCERP